MYWTAVSENTAIAKTSPDSSRVNNGDGKLVINLAGGFPHSGSCISTTVRVIDTTGATHDYMKIRVIVDPDETGGCKADDVLFGDGFE